jgi:hypothetical protein
MELLYIMASEKNKMNMNSFMDNIDEETKKEKLIEIMKNKIFNSKPKEEEETVILSNSWGYGINDRSFIG